MNEVANPYGNIAVTTPQRTGMAVDVESARAVAEVQAMVLMAKRFPRDPIQATERILNECQRQGLAEVAIYSYARGGTDIAGPSIRLAEAIARAWGNLDVGVKELSQSNGQSEMMSYCYDMETNVRHVKLFTVKHERFTKKGSYKLEDPRDVYEQTANQAARRLRAVILAAIPGDVIEAAVSQCEQTLKAKADTSPEAVKKMVEKFSEIQVTKDQIEKRIQRRVDAITPAQIISLRKVYNSINDGMSVASDWFEVVDASETPMDNLKTGTEKAKEALKRGRKPKDQSTTEPTGIKAEPAVVVDEPDELVDCPNGDRMKASYCNQGCSSRENCPAWPEREPGQDSE